MDEAAVAETLKRFQAALEEEPFLCPELKMVFTDDGIDPHRLLLPIDVRSKLSARLWGLNHYVRSKKTFGHEARAEFHLSVDGADIKPAVEPADPWLGLSCLGCVEVD